MKQIGERVRIFENYFMSFGGVDCHLLQTAKLRSKIWLKRAAAEGFISHIFKLPHYWMCAGVVLLLDNIHSILHIMFLRG
jgi:hypothetical protein